MIDLHTHSNFSDGTSSPLELLNLAQQAGLTALAITDHDTLAGFDAAAAVAGEFDMELVCGIELSTKLPGNGRPGLSLHVLGYFLKDVPGEDFRRWLTSITSTRPKRNLELMEKLRASGIDISWDDFPHLGPDRAARPDFARVLVAKGYVPDRRSAFERYLDDSVLGDIERKLPSPQEAIQRIRGSGGIAALAHPSRLRCGDASSLKSLVGELAHHGLRAIEVFHSEHELQETALFLEIAAERGLLVTGGSDYHGENKLGIKVGSGRHGNLHVHDELLDGMKEFLQRN